MSRTHKTKPLWVKMRQGHIQKGEWHDHVKGFCDLPEDVTEDFWQGGGHCHFTYEYTGIGFCCCRSCRWVEPKARAAAKVAVRKWDEEYNSDDAEYDYMVEEGDLSQWSAEIAYDYCPACYSGISEYVCAHP